MTRARITTPALRLWLTNPEAAKKALLCGHSGHSEGWFYRDHGGRLRCGTCGCSRSDADILTGDLEAIFDIELEIRPTDAAGGAPAAPGGSSGLAPPPVSSAEAS